MNKKSTPVTSRVGQAKYFFVASLILCLTSFAILVFVQFVRQPSDAFAGLDSTRQITQGSVTLGISGVKQDKGSGRYSAPTGSHFVVLTLTVRNNSDRPIILAPSNDTYMKSSLGDVTYLTPFKLTDPFRSGALLPGETLRGQLSYLVKSNVSYTYYIESDWSGGVIPLLL